MQVLEVLLGNSRDRDIVNIDLLLPDHVEQKIKGPFVEWQTDF